MMRGSACRETTRRRSGGFGDAQAEVHGVNETLYGSRRTGEGNEDAAVR